MKNYIWCIDKISVQNSVFPTLPKIHKQNRAQIPYLRMGYSKECAIIPIKVLGLIIRYKRDHSVTGVYIKIKYRVNSQTISAREEKSFKRIKYVIRLTASRTRLFISCLQPMRDLIFYVLYFPSQYSSGIFKKYFLSIPRLNLCSGFRWIISINYWVKFSHCLI